MDEKGKIPTGEWPQLLNRYIEENGVSSPEFLPRRVRKKFHGTEVTVWEGRVHVDDIEGYVENIRLKYFLNRWRARRGNHELTPATDEIYEIMLDADKEEGKDSKKPFHVERMAQNIALNGIQEPVILFAAASDKAELWDGNRRFFGTKHIMKAPGLAEYREQAKWVSAQLVLPSGSPDADARLKHCVLTELNFKEKDHIPWPNYVKAGEIFKDYERMIAPDPGNSTLRRESKEYLAREFGLKGWRTADRWIRMYHLATEFKDYHEEEHGREDVDVDLKIQDKFEYFDELSKAGVWGAIKDDPDAREEVFCWLWDDKFKAFTDVRSVPKILSDPVALRQANADDADGVKRAIATVIANDPVRVKDKEAANEKVKQFAEWLDSFKREDYKQLNVDTLQRLGLILEDVVKILDGLLNPQRTEG